MMLKINLKMKQKMKELKGNHLVLTDELQSIISSGFIEKEHCFFSKKLMNYSSSASKKHFQDCVGFECFVNSLHIDDYVDKNHLEYSILFCNSLLISWEYLNPNDKLNVIISLDEFGALIKFHLDRNGEMWLSEDLESYDEPILITNSFIKLQ
ncbi:hypothetical protein PTE_00793 [Photorhabdus khanii NC19]|uniref:Uncharacterized protein n=2 Tax=Photorhabdus khanii TaxID=1004150 RepID=W3VCV2_9GAMM|nr:hypothetical protein [Photorhabdus khanii]ETS33618.1 hypothetical protein PTE_00793 [Photorhabdus khanii NC19]MQL46485.1 hypothetical protein [Photorhabdus khanii]